MSWLQQAEYCEYWNGSSVFILLFLLIYNISMANKLPAFKSTVASSSHAILPDKTLHTQYLCRPIKEDSLEPIQTPRFFVKRKSYEVDTGPPPSKAFRPPSLRRSQSFSQRWIPLPPKERANPHTHACSIDNLLNPLPVTHHPFGKSTLPEATYKHESCQTAAMPYNNTAIPPPEEITGVASLPCK